MAAQCLFVACASPKCRDYISLLPRIEAEVINQACAGNDIELMLTVASACDNSTDSRNISVIM